MYGGLLQTSWLSQRSWRPPGGDNANVKEWAHFIVSALFELLAPGGAAVVGGCPGLAPAHLICDGMLWSVMAGMPRQFDLREWRGPSWDDLVIPFLVAPTY